MNDPEGHLFLFRARKTLAKMLMDRGFDNNQKLITMFETDFKDLKGKMKLENTFLELINSNGDKQVIVAFVVLDKFKKDDILKWYEYAVKQAKERKINTHLLIVLTGKPNSILEKMKTEQNHIHKQIKINEEQKVYVYGELWNAEVLQYNITESDLVPKHRLMSQTDVDAYLVEVNLTKTQLPKIKHNDPVARYFGARPGEVMKIERLTESSGISFYYRMVI